MVRRSFGFACLRRNAVCTNLFIHYLHSVQDLLKNKHTVMSLIFVKQERMLDSPFPAFQVTSMKDVTIVKPFLDATK